MTNSNGELPAGWRWVKLGEVCDFIRGVSFDPSDLSPHQTNGFLPIMRAGNIADTLNTNDDLVWVTAERISAKQKLQVGDIAICMSSGSPKVVGKTAQLKVQFEGSVGAFCGIIRPHPSEHSEYLAHWLLSPQFTDWRDGQARGANIQNLRFSQLANLELSLPSLAEQQRIAAVLNEQMRAVAQARAAAQAQLEAAKALPAAYLREVFESEEALGWKKQPLGAFCEIVAKQVDPKLPQYGALPHVNGENIESGACRITYLRSAAEDGMTSGKYLFEPGDVLYSKLRPYLRKAVYVDFRGVCSADMYPVRVNRQVVEPRFLAWLLVSDSFTSYADEESRRTRMPKLNREQLFAWYAPVPTLAEQQLFVQRLREVTSAAESTLKTLEAQLAAIEQLPGALLRRAFAGEL